MKQLILVGNQKVKFQDTETTISLTLVSDGNTVTIDSAKTYSVKIKNGTGYVKAITATPDTDNNMVTFSTAGFDGLPVDAYFIELWVLDTKGQTIYPSDSFIELDITANATGVQGQVVPAITLQEFEDRFGTLQSDLEAKVSTLIGPTGATGNGVSGVSIQYQLGADGNTIPTGTWSDTPSTPTDALPYMWTRNVTTYTDKSTSTSYNISAKGTKGNNFTIQGSTKTISGLPSKGIDGEGYMVGTELYVWTNGKWNDIVNMKGDKGDQGIQGIQGLTGNGISGVSTQYQLGTDGATIPTGTWNNTPSTPTDALPYMWTRNVTTYTDGSTHTSYNISAKGTKGNNFTIQGSTSSVAGLPSTGTDGEGYMVGTELYVWTNGKWNDIVNMKGVQGDRGIQGIQGIKGDTGNGIQSTSTDYQLSSQGVEVPNTGWSTTIPVTTNALPYLWTRVTITFTDGSQHVIYFTSNKGDKGDKGDTGEKGDTGANLAVKGALDKSTSLPSTGNSEGDAYLVGTDLYVYTNGAWKDCGPIVAENTVLYNADGSLNVNGTNFNYVQDLRNGKIQYNDGTKNVQVTPMDAGKEASDILAARNYTDSSVSALSNSVDTKLSSKANTADLSTGLATKADDSKVVHDNHDGTIQVNGNSFTPSVLDSVIGKNAQPIDTDVNTLVKPGMYYVSESAPNNPFKANTLLETRIQYNWDSFEEVQIAYKLQYTSGIAIRYVRPNGSLTGGEPDPWVILSDDSKVVHTSDMRKPASDVAGIEEVNTLQTQVDNSAVGTNLLLGTSKTITTVTNASGWNAGMPFYLSNVTTVNSDTPYTARTWISPASHDMSVQAVWKDSSGSTHYGSGNVISAGTSGYSTWAGTITAGSIIQYVTIVFRVAQPTDSSVSYGEAKLEKGSVATDWCPNSEDKVNVSDMRKPASDVAGIEEVNAKQDKLTITPADDSKVAHLSGANNFDTTPTVNNNPLLLASSLPSTLADTTKLSNFTAGLQSNGTAVATSTDLSTGLATKQDTIAYTTADDSKVVHTSDMRKPASDVAGIEEVNTLQTQVDNSAVGINLAFGTNQEYVMGFGIPNTVWQDGYAYEKLPLNTTVGEILPQGSHTFSYTLTKGKTYTQTVWLETDANLINGSGVQFTWYTSVGHDHQPATLVNLDENKYKVYSTYTWPGKSDNNLRVFDIYSLSSAFDLSTGTYLKFGKLKLEKGSLSTDWCPNPDDKVNVSDMRKPASDVAGIEEVNTKQDKIGYTPADDSKVVHTADMRKPASDVVGLEDVPTAINRGVLANGTDMDTVTQEGTYILGGHSFVNFIDTDVHWGILQVTNQNAMVIQTAKCSSNLGDIIIIRTQSGQPETWYSWNLVLRISLDGKMRMPDGRTITPADDSKVAHLYGANNFDTTPTVNNNPLLLASSLPSDIARTGQANTFSKQQTFSTNPTNGAQFGSQVWKFTADNSVAGLAVDKNGNVYAGTMGSSVYNLNSTGSQVWKFTADNTVRSVAVDTSVNVYAGTDGKSVYKINSTGSQVWQFTADAAVWGVTVDTSSNVYAGTDGKSVYKINSTGSQVWKFTADGAVHSVAVDTSGNVYAGTAGNSVYKIDSTGSQVWKFTADGLVEGLAVDTSGNVYAGTGLHSVYKLGSTGSQVWKITFDQVVSGVAVDTSGNVYVGTFGSLVYKLDSTGSKVWQFTTDSDTYCVAVDTSGNVYVGTHGCLVYKLDNTLQVYPIYATADTEGTAATLIASLQSSGFSGMVGISEN